jgi:hypothetical protein
MKYLAFSLMGFLLLPGCASMEASISLGAAVGAGAGFTASKIAPFNTKGSVVLAASGALIGGVIGALLHRDEPRPAPVNPFKENTPPLKQAETDVLLVPDSIQDGKFIERHRVWNIRSPAHWQNYPALDNTKETKSEERKPKKR